MLEEKKTDQNKTSLTTMELKTIRQRQFETLQELYAAGHSKKGIARLLGLDPKTIRRHLKKADWAGYQRDLTNNAGSLLTPFQDWLKARVVEVDYNAVVLFRELKAQGYEGSYETVKTFVAPLREQKSKACVRFETDPGQQAQVDWGSAWVWMGETQVKIHFFAMVLGYSRRLFPKAFMNEKFTSLIQAHEEAFSYFGGRTGEILYDNPKTMILSHNPKTREIVFNAGFKDFADYYGFEPRFCQPYRPQTKGKIESGVKYVKRNFLPGRRFKELYHVNEELNYWMVNVADRRVHGTTHERPVDRFETETLIPLHQCMPYRHISKIERKVAQDSFISFKNNRYSVPWMYVGRLVDLSILEGQLEIMVQGNPIVKHLLLTGKHEISLNKGHYTGLVRGEQQLLQKNIPEYDPRWCHAPLVMERDLEEYDRYVSQGGALC